MRRMRKDGRRVWVHDGRWACARVVQLPAALAGDLGVGHSAWLRSLSFIVSRQSSKMLFWILGCRLVTLVVLLVLSS